MDDKNQDHMQTPVSGDDDLAKALSDQGNMSFEETPMPSMVDDNSPQGQSPRSSTADDSKSMPAVDEPEPMAAKPHSGGNLDKIKDEVVQEIKPLLGKLDLPAEEKFDTMLLIIRSTDDQGLLQATFDAAKEIKDESKRAKALLDVMREVSYFSGKK